MDLRTSGITWKCTLIMAEHSDEFDEAWDEYNQALKDYHAAQFEAHPKGLHPTKMISHKAKISVLRTKINNLYMETQKEALEAKPGTSGEYAALLYHPSIYYTLDTYPGEGELAMLLVDGGPNSDMGLLEDQQLFWTIGSGQEDFDSGEIIWNLVGWNWEQDHFYNFVTDPDLAVKVLGWKPFPQVTMVEPS